MNNIEQILEEIKTGDKDVNWLSSAAVQLSVLLYNLGDEVAAAELAENEAAIRCLTPIGDEKKISVAESEKIAIVETQNSYGRLKLEYQSLVEIIQSCKKKVDSLSNQMKSGI